jgi:hypothetical protein
LRQRAKQFDFGDMTHMVSSNVDQAAKAMQNYFQFWKNNMSNAPWGKTDLIEKIKNSAEKNVALVFEYGPKVISTENIEDVVRIQTEFMQKQLQALNEQAKKLAETATKTCTGAKRTRRG